MCKTLQLKTAEKKVIQFCCPITGAIQSECIFKEHSRPQFANKKIAKTKLKTSTLKTVLYFI